MHGRRRLLTAIAASCAVYAVPVVTVHWGDLFGLSLVSARTFAALAHSFVLVLTGLMARELGGRPVTQVLAALAAAIAPIALIQGSLIQYVTFDFLWSVLIA